MAVRLFFPNTSEKADESARLARSMVLLRKR